LGSGHLTPGFHETVFILKLLVVKKEDQTMATIYGEQQTDLGQGHYMETQAYLDTGTGQITAFVHTWCTNWVIGFTGAMGLIVFDRDDNLLKTEIEVEWPLGVDARGVFWNPSSRTDEVHRQIDPAIAAQVRKILIVHSHRGKDRSQEVIREAEEVARTVGEVVVIIASLFA